MRYQISSAGNRLCVSYRNSRVWKKDSTLKWSSWNRSALFLSTSIPFSLVSRSSTPSCYFAYRKWRRLGLQSRKRRAIYLHKLHLQRRLVFSEKNLCDNALLGHAVAQQTTIISLFCRAITIQNKPGRPKTKYWRLLLMLVWKNKQQHKRELVLPCRGEGCSAGYSAPFNGSKGEKLADTPNHMKYSYYFWIHTSKFPIANISITVTADWSVTFQNNLVKWYISCTRTACFVTIPWLLLQTLILK